MEGRWYDLEYKDYYKALGISKTATQKEVQGAYRKLARKLHPDVNKKPDAEDSFKAINEAYEVLKDPEKRERYDTLGANWREGERYSPPPGSENIHFDFGDGNAGQFSDFFQDIFGRGRTQSRFNQERPGWAMRGADQETDMDLTLEEAYHGAKKTLRLQQLEKEGSAYVPKSREININIPSGVSEGSRIRLSGQGGPGSGGQNGDLYLRIHVLPHKVFKLTDTDLEVEMPISPWEAALGTKVELSTLTGKVNLNIPAGVQSGQKLRLRGKGMPAAKGLYGDLFAVIKIAVPKTLNERERELFEELSRVSSFSPRPAGREA
ncbi:MAG: DnaJ C-terminal domain-containing protein [Syntrophomonas sp.]|nr:DnaJ C-terminal domain-containing protein [Syntrophomonas sp.]